MEPTGPLWSGARCMVFIYGLKKHFVMQERNYRANRICQVRKYFKSSFVPDFKKPVEGTFPPETNHPKNAYQFFTGSVYIFPGQRNLGVFPVPDFTSAWRILHSMFVRIPNRGCGIVLAWYH